MDPNQDEPSRERWAELPTMSSVAMHDMLATAVAVADAMDSSDDQVPSGHFPKANPFFREPRSDSEKSIKREHQITSPFYETLKLLTRDVVPIQTIEEAQLEDPSTYHPVSKQLRDTIILILTHSGFSEASNEVIECLTDILECYLKNFCTLLRQFTDSADHRSPSDFVDSIVKVLHHMRVPDYDALLKFNQELVAYQELMKKAHKHGHKSKS